MDFVFGWSYCALWYVSIFSGFMSLFCPILPLVFISNKLYRKTTDFLFTFWQFYNTALLTYLCNCKIIVTGDSIKTNETSILISNHRTRTDWNFLWPTLYHAVHGKYRVMHSAKFVLKDIIRNIPGPGWVMQMSCFVYIKRMWEKDSKIFEKYVQYTSDMSYKHCLVLFPEGTDLTLNTKRNSDKFAEKYNLQKYDYVLHPRTTGFAFLTHKMLQMNNLDAIYDITLTYPDVVPQTEKVILMGNFPKIIRVHLVRYSKNMLPSTEDGLKLFLEQKWEEKEKILKEFYSTGHFLHGNILKIKNKPILMFSLAFWTLLPFFTLYLFIFNQNFRFIVIFNTIFLLFVNFLYDGFQNFEIAVYNFKKKIFRYCKC